MRTKTRFFAFSLLPLFFALAIPWGVAEKEGIAIPLNRGINLGNMLEASSEGAWGEFYQDQYAALIKACGFDHVRLPVAWSEHASLLPPFTLSPAILSRVDHIIETLEAQGLAVVLDFHHYQELSLSFDEHLDRFLAIWAQLSAHYAEHSGNVFFELLNEPVMEPSQWNRLISLAMPIIREENPGRYVLITCVGWGSAANLYSVNLPAGDERIIGTFHLYEPFQFTHQGADWAGSESESRLGQQWIGTFADQSDILEAMDLAKAWSERYEIPVYLGEFGAYQQAEDASRIAWTRFMARQSEAHGFGWGYWEFCAGFGIYDDKEQVFHEGLLDALIPDRNTADLLGILPTSRNWAGIQNYICYYGDAYDSKLEAYDMAILQADAFTSEEIQQLRQAGVFVLGYLSLGEDGTLRRGNGTGPGGHASWYYKDESGQPLENQNWGSYFVNPGDDAWQAHVLSQARALMEMGCDGFFLDTLDTVDLFPDAYAGMTMLVERLRQAFAGGILVANRGFTVLPSIAWAVDGVMFEGFSSGYDFSGQAYTALDAETLAYNEQLIGEINGLREDSPFHVFALDYTEDMAFAKECEARAKRLGCIPYVTTIHLDEIP